MTGHTLTTQALNRATLARQLLLPRAAPVAAPRDAEQQALGDAASPAPEAAPRAPRDAAVVRAVERVGGLQSQDSRAAAIGLWTRLPGLRREQLAGLLLRRLLVKGTLMRATQHVVSAADYLVLRPALQPTLTAWAEAVVRRRVPGVALAEVAAVARPWFAEPHSARELRDRLHELYPGTDAEALSIAVRAHLPLLQVPVAGAPWGVPGNPTLIDAVVWLERELPPADLGALVTRYLAAFGPARLADVQRWSGVTRLGAAAQGLGPRLRRLRDERGRELLDLEREALPAGALPRPAIPARPTFLPTWDNTLLAYVDAERVVPAQFHQSVYQNRQAIGPAVLLDGFAAATWALEREPGAATVVVRALAELPGEAREALARTGERLARFASPGAVDVAVRFAP